MNYYIINLLVGKSLIPERNSYVLDIEGEGGGRRI